MRLLKSAVGSSLIIFILLAVTCLSVQAQETQLYKYDSVPLGEVLRDIESNTGLSFAYNSDLLDVSRLITLDDTLSLQDLLHALFDPFFITFDLLEQQIVLKRQVPQHDEGRLSGYVYNHRSGEPLIGATIWIESLKTGVTTNPFGYYSLKAPAGIYEVAYSYLGYEPATISMMIDGSVQHSPEMQPTTAVLDEVIVLASKTEMVSETPGAVSLQPATIEDIPAIFGERDVVKSLELQPGIQAHSDGSTFFYVRGGQRDQNLILIDDAPIFNASHLLGVFSNITPDAINSVTIYKGHTPASMGGRLSSVIDIRTKKGNNRQTEVWGSLGLVSAKLGVEGPLKKNKSSYLVSGRVSRLRWLFNALDEGGDNVKKFNFYDLTGKMNFDLREQDNIYFSAYLGKDNYFIDNFGLEWETLAGSFRWNHLFSDKLFLNTTLAASSYDYFLHTDVSTNTRWKSRIGFITLKADLSHFKSASSVFTYGLAVSGYNFNPGNYLTGQENVQPPLVSIKNSSEVVLYANHEVKFSPTTKLDYGLRLSAWSNQGNSFEFEFDETGQPTDTLFFDEGESYQPYSNLEPRIALIHQLGARSSLRLSYSRQAQYLHLISNSISPFSSLEVWLPSSVNIEPQTSNQLSVGFRTDFHNRSISLLAEAYTKRMDNQIDFVPHAETLLNPTLESELLFGEANAYGIEISAKKEVGKTRGLLSYSYSRVRRQFEGLNNGQVFNAFNDRPHDINISLSHDVSSRTTLGANWIFYTGSPYSAPVGFYRYNDLEVPIYGDKNNARLPDYHRLDLSVTYQLNKPANASFEHFINFSIFNIYGHENVLFINHNKVQTEDDKFRIGTNLLENQRLTTKTYLFPFAPSLTYNFRFL